MKRNVFTTSAAPRQESSVAVNCIACNNTGYVPHPVFRERQMPCACQMKRLVPVPEVMTLADAIKAKKQSCGCQTHDHHPSVSSDDDAAAAMTSQSLTKHLQTRRTS